MYQKYHLSNDKYFIKSILQLSITDFSDGPVPLLNGVHFLVQKEIEILFDCRLKI